eukprot:gene6015-12127_t
MSLCYDSDIVICEYLAAITISITCTLLLWCFGCYYIYRWKSRKKTLENTQIFMNESNRGIDESSNRGNLTRRFNGSGSLNGMACVRSSNEGVESSQTCFFDPISRDARRFEQLPTENHDEHEHQHDELDDDKANNDGYDDEDYEEDHDNDYDIDDRHPNTINSTSAAVATHHDVSLSSCISNPREEARRNSLVPRDVLSMARLAQTPLPKKGKPGMGIPPGPGPGPPVSSYFLGRGPDGGPLRWSDIVGKHGCVSDAASSTTVHVPTPDTPYFPHYSEGDMSVTRQGSGGMGMGMGMVAMPVKVKGTEMSYSMSGCVQQQQIPACVPFTSSPSLPSLSSSSSSYASRAWQHQWSGPVFPTHTQPQPQPLTQPSLHSNAPTFLQTQTNVATANRTLAERDSIGGGVGGAGVGTPLSHVIVMDGDRDMSTSMSMDGMGGSSAPRDWERITGSGSGSGTVMAAQDINRDRDDPLHSSISVMKDLLLVKDRRFLPSDF